MTVSFIVAASENRVIGRGNKLPWNIPEDLDYFKRMTSGHPIIMGRKTFESMGQVLPKRTNVIVTRQKNYHVEGGIVVDSIEKALDLFRDKNEEVFIIGGGEIFRQALPIVHKIYLTLIHRQYQGDAFFPEWNPDAFVKISQDDRHDPVPFSFLVYERKN